MMFFIIFVFMMYSQIWWEGPQALGQGGDGVACAKAYAFIFTDAHASL